MKTRPKAKRKNKPGGGRKPEGRTRKIVLMHEGAWALLDAQKDGAGDTRGKVIERLLGFGSHAAPQKS